LPKPGFSSPATAAIYRFLLVSSWATAHRYLKKEYSQHFVIEQDTFHGCRLEKMSEKIRRRQPVVWVFIRIEKSICSIWRQKVLQIIVAIYLSISLFMIFLIQSNIFILVIINFRTVDLNFALYFWSP
jgi:hypothetical protein